MVKAKKIIRDDNEIIIYNNGICLELSSKFTNIYVHTDNLLRDYGCPLYRTKSVIYNILYAFNQLDIAINSLPKPSIMKSARR